MAKRRSSSAATRHRSSRPRRAWSRYTTEDLLELRLNELHLRIEGTWIESAIERLYDELEARELVFRPRAWLSSEWFAPDGIPGIAIPFYLAHPRLMRLEKQMMLQVEGGTKDECMRILRHEAGHAIDNAYRLHYRKRWRQLFGNYSQPYPKFYRPNPGSREYVLHLNMWYAQAHPAEDFAETFAVWLNPRSRWRKRYEGWPALRKLEYVDQLMKELIEEPPVVTSRRTVEPLSSLRTKLRDHYRQRRLSLITEWPDFYDADLRKVFSSEPHYRRRPTAAQFLRQNQARIRGDVSYWTGVHPYTIDQVLQDMVDRCKELGLRMMQSEREALTNATMMVTVSTVNFLHSRRYWVPL